MDGRRNFPPDPDAEPRWYPDDRGYDDRGRDERRDDRARDERGREGRPVDDRGYGDDDRGYTPTRYADERDYGDAYRVPEPRTISGRGYSPDAPAYGDSPSGVYGDSPSGQFSAPARPGEPGSGFARPGEPGSGFARPGEPGEPGSGFGVDSGEFTGESVSRSRRSEAIDRSALQRPVSGAPTQPTLPAPASAPPGPGGLGGGPGGLGGGPGGLGGGPGGMPGGPGGAPNSFSAPTTLTAAIPAPSAEPGGAVYRSKRPGLATALVVLTIVFELPVLRLFFTAATAGKIEAAGTLASIFMLLGLPMFALGLYGLIGGAAAAGPGGRAWLRTPLAYLPVALLLFIAAALST